MLNRRTFFQGTAAAMTAPLLHPLRSFANAQPLDAVTKLKAEVHTVRITDVESFRVRIPKSGAGEPTDQRVYDYGVSHVHTDAGITGVSFIPCPDEILQRWVKPTLLGQDLFAIDRNIDRLQMERGESGVQIWSGVEHAMWDAIGKIAGLPVAKLLGAHAINCVSIELRFGPGRSRPPTAGTLTRINRTLRMTPRPNLP